MHRTPETPPGGPVAGPIRFAEFVTLMALMMALTALSIDVMLPALPGIAGAFGVAEPNDRQLVITAYLLGYALGQPFYGPLSDRFGRKPILVAGLGLSAIGSLGAMAAPGFDVLLWSRAVQGFGAAAPRVMVLAIVRDRFGGRDMARVMSLVMMIFIIVPMLAPAMGGAILQLGPWRWIFAWLALVSLLILLWAALRLPETRASSDSVPLSAAALGRAAATTLRSRRTLGYTVALGFLFGNLMAYIGSAQQIFVEVYGLGALFPLAFAAVASLEALAAFTNARLVGRLGMRRVSHAALLAYVLICAVMALAGYPEEPPLLVFCAFLAATFFCFGLVVPNFNALAMEPLGHIAGMASSFVGSYTTAAGAVFGWLVGQAFDGTVRPLTVGFTALAALALLIVLATERGRLALRHDEPGRTRTISGKDENV